MNLAWTLETAARIVSRADLLIDRSAVIPDTQLYAYWEYSRELTNRWLQSLAICQKVIATGNVQRSRLCWLEYEPDIRDILRADVLQRVWYIILLAADRRQQRIHAEPIARTVLSSQLQARIRALRLIMAGHQFDAARMQNLNQLRKNSENWSDFLCAHLAEQNEMRDFLYEPRRADRWGQQPLTAILPDLRLPGTSTALKDLQTLVRPTAHPEATDDLQKLTRKIINCFPPGVDDGFPNELLP